MNRKLLAFLVLTIMLLGGFWLFRSYFSDDAPATTPPTTFDANDPSLLGVFEGRIPCADCERTKVRLILYQNQTTKTPTTYILERINVGESNERHITNGNWTISHGTKADPEAVVYQLDTKLEGFRTYQALAENILLFLEEDMSLKVGDPGHSYTLSKTN